MNSGSANFSKRRVGVLSTGMRQRAALARTAHDLVVPPLDGAEGGA